MAAGTGTETVEAGNTERVSSRTRPRWIGAVALIILFCGYMSTWWNHGIALNSNGLGTLAGQAILDGKMPYRDFHFWCPPVHLLLYSTLIAAFGNALIFVRAFAVVEHLATFLILYFWLARIFDARVAFFGTFAAAVGFCSDIADVIAHYDYDAVLATVAAGACASMAITSGVRYPRLLRVATGICAGICLMAKQTTGVGVFLIFPLLFFVDSPGIPIRRRMYAVVEFLAGWSIPVGLLLAWLAHGSAFGEFGSQVFAKGTSSKGSLVTIVFRPVLTLFYNGTLAFSFFLAALTVAGIAILCRRQFQERHVTDNGGSPLPLSMGALFALAAGFLIAGSGLMSLRAAAYTSTIASVTLIFVTYIGCTILAVRYSVKMFFGERSEEDRQMWLLATVSFMVAYMFSLSFAAYERMLIPGFAFLASWFLHHQLKSRRAKVAAASVTVLGMLLITNATTRKLTWPYIWENWSDGPIRAQTVEPRFLELRGLRITPENDAFLTRVTAAIETHSLPSESILCYPNYALFYVLSHRSPVVFAYMHWFDVTPDYLAHEDALRIREHPPAVILFVDMPETDIARLERIFRGNKRSGQRELISTIESLPGYRVVDTVPIPGVGCSLKIFALH